MPPTPTDGTVSEGSTLVLDNTTTVDTGTGTGSATVVSLVADPDDTPARALDLSGISSLVRSVFYRTFDRPSEGLSYWVRGVYPAYLVAYEENARVHWRVGFVLVDDRTVTFDAPTEWQAVENEWLPVDVDVEAGVTPIMREEKAALIMADNGDDAATRAAGAWAGHPATVNYRRDAVEIRETSDENVSTFFIMSGEIARDGAIVEPDGVETGPFMANPVVLWSHGNDPVRGGLPIARCLDLTLKTVNGVRGILARIEWYDDEFSANVREMVRRKFLSMPSIRWIPLEVDQVQRDGQTVIVFTRSELTEFSVVPVGADRNATVLQRDAYAETLSAVRAELASLREQVRTLTGPANAAPPTSDDPESTDPEPSAVEVPADPEDVARFVAYVATRVAVGVVDRVRTVVEQQTRTKLGLR